MTTQIIREEPKIVSPDTIFKLVKSYASKSVEHFLVISLNGANNATKLHVVSKGILNKTIVHPREIFRQAIKDNANHIVLVHNHPSGELEPSNEDIDITKRLSSAGDLLGIKVLDHLIISKKGYYSFVEIRGIL